jgi:hypothetical protein
MSPVLRPSHRRHPADLGVAVASSEAAASVKAVASDEAVSAEDVASVEVDSAAHMGALATARDEFAPSVPSNRLVSKKIRAARDYALITLSRVRVDRQPVGAYLVPLLN